MVRRGAVNICPACNLWGVLMTTDTMKRAFYKIPVLGWMARDVAEGDKDNIWYALAALAALWAIAVMTWGLPALYLPAVLAAPLMLVLLVLITLG